MNIPTTNNKDTITNILKIVSAVYLILNTVRLGIELHEKITHKKQSVPRR